MGCISSKKEIEDIYPNIFQVMNVDEHGNHVNPGQLEITDVDLVLYQRGKSPIKWPLRTLRRYGFDAEHFSFESGRRCQTGPGIYAFRCRRAEQLFNLLQSRIQTRNNGESEINENSNSFGNSITNRDSMYLEPAPLRRANPGSRFSSQNGMTRLSSVGSASGSVGPLSPQSVVSAPLPLDTVPLIPSLTAIRNVNQNLYANEDVIAAVTLSQDLEETNNNKTIEEPLSPPFEHTYLNAAALELLPNECFTNANSENHNEPFEEVSSPDLDNKHLYMNIIPGTDKVAPRFNVHTQSAGNFASLNWEKTEDSMPNYENSDFKGKGSLPRNFNKPCMTGTPSVNYIVLDLPNGDPPKSPIVPVAPDVLKKQSRGYAAIDFKKTVALSHSVNPNFDTDCESSRKTRHSSNINNLFYHDRHSSSVSD